MQVKTSEGKGIKDKNNELLQDVRNFSFHPKIRYDLDNNVFYVWIAVFADSMMQKTSHFCHTELLQKSEVSQKQ